MLFNSYIYIYVFLPLMVLGYHSLNRWRLILPARAFLVVGSLFFYSWWNLSYLPLILISVTFNYAMGSILCPSRRGQLRVSPKLLLTVGIVGNLSALAYFKYVDFLIKNVNQVFESNITLLQIALPLAISFFTFQQVAYLVDSYRGATEEYDFLNYCLFVTFFPQLIAGPIVHHKEVMDQFSGKREKVLQWKNIYLGVGIFAIGIFKKVFIADAFSLWVQSGYEAAELLNCFEAWCTSLCYTLQIYYDFSGYTDMAIGSALLFNIKIPANFNSPYKAVNIQDFWRRWHITLSRWLRDYLYIPLGGGRSSELKVYFNLFVTFLIGGLWHGAGWNFVVWGALHGVGCAVHRFWSKLNIKIYPPLAWGVTFVFINITWIFFRAENITQAMNIIGAMFQAGEGLSLSHLHIANFTYKGGGDKVVYWIVVFLAISFLFPNSNELSDKALVQHRRPRWIVTFLIVILFLMGMPRLEEVSEFLYFNF